METAVRPAIELDLCESCGACVEACPLGALVMVPGGVAVRNDVECEYCGDCEAVCPTGAISCPYEIVVEG